MNKRAIATILIATFTMTVTPASAAPPDNDNYAHAIMIDALPFSDARDVSEATTEALESLSSCAFPPGAPAMLAELTSGYGSVWYRFDTSADIGITIDPAGSDSSMLMVVYRGEDLATQQEVACAGSNQGSGVLAVDLPVAGSYAIQLISFSTLEGTDLSVWIDEGKPLILPPDPVFRADASLDPATGDATVIAVIDTGIAAYHWDFLASRMPQALDDNAANDLPLSQPPHTWLQGFPEPDAAFDSYASLELTLEEADPRPTHADLREADAVAWDGVRASAPDEVNYHWVPGTKLIGALTFAPQGRVEPPDGIRHGTPVASAAVGNYVGTCPECLLVFVQVDPAETTDELNNQTIAAFEWALAQPWIDVVSSSQAIAYEVLPPEQWHPNYLDSSFDTEVQRLASERGQTYFQASGNGMRPHPALAFLVPNPAITNSGGGPDWLITVGGVTPDGDHLLGAGKPVDIAAPAQRVRAANADAGIGEHDGRWAGTSFSTPVVAGVYAHALYHARRALPGASRTQEDGIIARAEDPVSCGEVRAECELGDGTLTATELRRRLLDGAVPTVNGATGMPFGFPPGSVEDPPPVAREWQLMNQGHGTYFGRMQADADWLAEVDRVLDPILGDARTLERPDGEREWMIVDSYCRQEIWGSWNGGYYMAGKTPLPGPDVAWPIRSAIEATCPYLPVPVPQP